VETHTRIDLPVVASSVVCGRVLSARQNLDDDGVDPLVANCHTLGSVCLRSAEMTGMAVWSPLDRRGYVVQSMTAKVLGMPHLHRFPNYVGAVDGGCVVSVLRLVIALRHSRLFFPHSVPRSAFPAKSMVMVLTTIARNCQPKP
jgi:hypothetical protein